MTHHSLTIATRQSPLALWQANHIRAQINHYWPQVEVHLLPMKTSGDKFLKDKLINEGGKGLFVKELEEALLSNRADLAVHSMKDVPSTFPEGLDLPIICERHNPFDAMVSNQFNQIDDLPLGAVVGTVSLRRQTQLLRMRPDLQMKSLRGNILTRLNKLDAGDYDAIILAVAGLERMGMQDRITEIFTAETMLPACGQGALGIECREDDEATAHLLAPLNDPTTALCVRTERRVNELLGGNCHTPLAVFCSIDANANLILQARIASVSGQIMLSHVQKGTKQEALKLAENCAKALIADGAEQLIEAAKQA